MTEDQKQELQATFNRLVENDIAMLAGTFEAAQLFNDWESARATLETTFDLLWLVHSQINPLAPETRPAESRPDWYDDWLSADIPQSNTRTYTWSSDAVDRPVPPAWNGVTWELVNVEKFAASNFKRWEFMGTKASGS